MVPGLHFAKIITAHIAPPSHLIKCFLGIKPLLISKEENNDTRVIKYVYFIYVPLKIKWVL